MAALMATAASCGALSVESEPLRPPIGVRAPARITMSSALAAGLGVVREAVVMTVSCVLLLEDRVVQSAL